MYCIDYYFKLSKLKKLILNQYLFFKSWVEILHWYYQLILSSLILSGKKYIIYIQKHKKIYYIYTKMYIF